MAILEGRDLARRDLESMRKNPWPEKMNSFLRDVRKLKLTLEDFGTTQEEIDDLTRRGHVRKFLSEIRGRSVWYDFEFLYRDVPEPDLVLRDLGLTRANVAWLNRDRAVARVKYAIKEFRDPANRDGYQSIKNMMDHFKMTFTEIGTTEEELRQLQRAALVYSAGHYLKLLQEGDRRAHVPGKIEHYLKEAGATHDEIGISSEELARIKREVLLENAKRLLEDLRDATYEDLAPEVRRLLAEANATPEDIGSTPAELEELLRASKLELVRCDLESLRKQDCGFNSAPRIRRTLAELGVTLEEVGTSDAELEERGRAALLENARRCLKWVKNGHIPSDILESLFRCLREANASLEDIGTTLPEITGDIREVMPGWVLDPDLYQQPPAQ